jgi:hypothetical protein
MISSCTQYTRNIAETQYAFNETLSLHIDSIVIPLDSISLPSYFSRSAYYENDTCSLLFAFNSKTWNIDVFNLKKGVIEKHIPLEKEGKDAIMDILSLQIISPDSFFIHEGYHFIFTNGEGKVLNRIYSVLEQNDYIAFLGLTSPSALPYFNPADNKIYGRYATTRQAYPIPEKELFATYDMTSQVWQILSVKIPDYYDQIWEKLGRNIFFNASFYDDRICYSFTALSDIFVYFMTENKETISGGASQLINNNVRFYDGNKQSDEAKWLHYLNNPVFAPIIYDSCQKKYYRIAFGDMMTSSHSTNSFYDKKIILSVFDESLRLIFESALPNYTLFLDPGYFLSSKGLLIFGNNPENPELNDEELVIYCISIESMI